MMRSSPPRGFTLIEVLVALAIVAITLAAGSRAAETVLRNGDRFADVTLAQWCADNTLVGLRFAQQLPGIGRSEQGCEQLGQAYTVQLNVQSTPNPSFRRVDVRVLDAEQAPVVSVSAVLGRP
ncbi:type II secretion system minor pseudopilin GspI [Vitreoscilla filiformis]|jgi:general secretion pathway protein I|uniref:type II secretion system minor pseudopilin GspI n=1 Tax=Vitreoscilla filiformis TaxID=63 RepID=UPI0018DFD777|nr:type II secretion system minor pseudopilin GspI [Vitreoscilla filiformis]